MDLSHIVLLVILHFGLASPSQAQKQCYYPNGSLSTTDVPCDPSSEVSMCCGSSEACLSNGLCFNQSDLSLNRNSCTDQSWGSSCHSWCFHISRGSPVNIWPCGDSTWCCGPSDCCSGNFTKFNPGGGNVTALLSSDEAKPSLQSITSSGSGSLSTSSSSSSMQQDCSAEKHPKPCIRAEAAIGVGVGFPLASLATLMGILYFRERSRRRKSESNTYRREATTSSISATSVPTSTPTSIPTYYTPESTPTEKQTKPDHRRRNPGLAYELPEVGYTAEMATTSRPDN